MKYLEMNYQLELEKIMNNPQNRGKKLLLHSCCAPCSSYVLVYLSTFFDITVFYYNPNISDAAEYEKRVQEQKRFIASFHEKKRLEEKDQIGVFYPISFIEGNYEPELFYKAVKGLEHLREGGERCERCFELRLRKTAEIACQNGFDYFTTTLSISPMKNAKILNTLGEAIAVESDQVTSYLYSDFKKKDGYKQSIALSKEFDLYRQDFCGCVFSKRSSEEEAQKCEYE